MGTSHNTTQYNTHISQGLVVSSKCLESVRMSQYSAQHNRHPYSEQDNFGGRVHHTRNQKATIKAFDKFYSWFPSFLDIFPDEDAFLNFAFWFVILTIVGAFVAARFIKIKPHQI